MKCLVRVQEGSAGKDQSDHKPSSNYGCCGGAEMMLEPDLDEALPSDWIEFALSMRKIRGRFQIFVPLGY
jgi:hypothetical protein